VWYDYDTISDWAPSRLVGTRTLSAGEGFCFVKYSIFVLR